MYLVLGCHVLDAGGRLLHELQVTTLDVLRAVVGDAVLAEVYGALVVHIEVCGEADALPEVQEEVAQVDGFKGSQAAGHDLRFGRGHGATAGCFLDK